MKNPNKDDLKNPQLQFQLVHFIGDLYHDAYKMRLFPSIWWDSYFRAKTDGSALSRSREINAKIIFMMTTLIAFLTEINMETGIWGGM